MRKIDSQNLYSRCTDICEAYEQASTLRYTIRSGRIKNRVCKAVTEEERQQRAESVAEHSYMMAKLWALILIHFPEYFPAERNFVTLLVALTHDIPEGALGDVPDDGNPEHDEAKDVEARVMQDYLLHFPRRYRGAVNADYQKFESAGETADEEMIALKMVDKLEAVLGLLVDERRGLRGEIVESIKNVSKRDLGRGKYLGTTNPTDIWMFGLRRLMAEKSVPDWIEELIIALARTEFLRIRGEIPFCLTADVWAVE